MHHLQRQISSEMFIAIAHPAAIAANTYLYFKRMWNVNVSNVAYSRFIPHALTKLKWRLIL